MKKTLYIFITIFLVSAISLYSQKDEGDGVEKSNDKVEYTYDKAGNRTSQRIVYLKGNDSKEEDDEEIKPKSVEEEDVLKHNFGEREIHVYPNPTKGLLTIEIWKGNDEENYRLVLYDSAGKQLSAFNHKGNGRAPVDLSMYPKGIYIVIVHTADGKMQYKIIKE